MSTQAFLKRQTVSSFDRGRSHTNISSKKTFSLKESVNFQQSKYILDLLFQNLVFWKTEQNNLVAFGIKYNKTLKWFHAEKTDLEALYRELHTRIFFGNISSIYESQEVIGAGASCKVYKVVNKITRYEFASKCIRKDYIFNKKNQERYNRLILEIELMKLVDHNSIVKMVDLYEGEKSYYIIMELLKGETLYQFSKKTQLNLLQIKLIMSNCLKGLCYLNFHNIIHRDLKLENLVLLEPNKVETVKIIDFGLAIPLSTPQRQICGTPGYIAPEMFIDKYPYTAKVDMFSLGVIFYRLLSRKSLFSGNNSDEILENNKKFRCNNHLKDCSNEISDLLKQMLQKDPNKRISPEQALRHPFFDDTISGDLGVADESPHEIVRAFPLIKPMQITNSNENISDNKIQVIRGSQPSFEQSIGSNYSPSFDDINKKSRNGSDHIIE
ncbi:unnamed protein product (macronuclear) [Paramecium tetraurelia]|uniref:Protein kinase domain-containing protein n=1 Tax=Paramecium tetraurelia TaxID=5888 RepID=A0DU91_PARTE|nr:uncharacterized protein GSPATT00020280001 [Paramecium tetraurelia]CAK86608.1 unnamed protein product [Paramecium tetraurelia]|eukprot:XP_001454005.1 hypothetical protein (macronuclear) [Paramecium tetraurelia strain d4-2]